MKNMRDEDIQKLFTEEQAHKKPDTSGKSDPDFQVYRYLFDALETDPDYSLSADFADKMLQKISWRQTVKVFVRQLLLVAACVTGGIGIGIGVTYYVNTALGTQFLQMADQAKWIIVFGFAIFIIIQFLDKLFIYSLIFHEKSCRKLLILEVTE
jgi:hypothetical protein